MSEYQDGYNHAKNGGSWRNDFTNSQNSGFNAAKQQEESYRFQQFQQQQDAQRRQQENAQRSQQQFIDTQAAQQRQQVAWRQSFPSLGRTYGESTYRRDGAASSRPGFVSSRFSSVSSAPFTSSDWKALTWLSLLGVFGVVVYGAINVISPYLPGQKIDVAGSEFLRAQPRVADGVYTYAGSDVMKLRWLHDKDHPMHLNGRTVVVTGDVDDANIHINGNVAFQGTLRHVSVVDNDWTITANKVEDSALTARKIVITGAAVRTTETLTAEPTQPKQKRKRR